MVYVGSSWVELDYWTSPIGNDEDVRMRALAKSSQNVAGNYSRIDFKLQKRITGGSAYNYYNRDFTIKMDGHRATQTWVLGSITDTSWTDVGGDTSDMYWSEVSHNADGTLTISANAFGDRPMSGEFDTDITIELPRIPRASSPSVSPNPQTWSSTNTNRITVNTNRKSSGFTHKIRCDVWGFQQTKTGVGASTTFDIPYSALASMPDNLTSFSGSIHTQTYSGSTAIGSEVRTYWTIKLDTSLEHPNIGTITVEDTNSRTSAIVGAETFIYGISTLQATIPLTVSGSYTQLASATVTCGTKSQTYTLSGTSQTITFTFDKVNASSLKVTVKDKRGTSVTKTKTYTLMPYQPVTATATVGRVTATGSTAVGQVSGVAYGGNYGQASNELTITYKYKEHDSPTWTDSAYSATLTLNSGQQTYTHAITLLEEYDYQKQYDIQFIVNDLFNTATYTAQLMQGLPIMSWDENEVDIFGDLHIHDRNDPYLWQDVMGGLSASALNVQPNGNSASAYTQNGITVTLHADRSLTINGTATGRVFYNLNIMTNYEAGVTYRLRGFRDQYVDGLSACVRPNSTETTLCRAYRDDATFVAPNEPVFTYVFVDVGVTCNNVKYYPQIVDDRYAVQEYQLYKPFQPLVVDAWTSSTNYTATSSTGTVMRSRNIAYLDAGKYLFIGGGAFYVSNNTGTMRMVITAGGVTKMSRTLCGTNSQNNTNSASGMIIWQNEEALTNVTIQCVLTTQQSGMTTTAPSYRQRWYCMMRLDDSSTVNDVYV